MKKILIFFSILLFPFFIFAKEYEVEDINLKLDIRDDYIVFSRDNLENNTDLTKLNITKDNMITLMNNNNIYLDIIKNDLNYEILLVVPNTTLSINNLSNATDDILNDMKNEYIKKTGSEVANVYKNNYNFIVVDYFDDKTNYYIVNYYTVVNAKGYNFQLQKKSQITEDEKNDLKELVDSVNIKVLDEYKNESEEVQKSIDNYNKKGFNFMNIVYGAIIGAIGGLISYGIGLLIRKKKSSV